MTFKSGTAAYRNAEYRRRTVAGVCKSCNTPVINKSVCEFHWALNIAQKRLGTGRLACAILQKLKDQKYLCPYTGDRLVPGLNASLDHIKPVSIYPELAKELSNVEWVHIDVNLAKRTMDKDAFLSLCHRIAIHKAS